MGLSELTQSKVVIPAWLIWIQCIAFVVLYAVWILPEIVGFRNTALVVGALAGLYPIHQFRTRLFQRRAAPIWLIVALFAWALFHLVFISQDYAAQLLELKRIWKYAALAAIFAFGFGLSLSSAINKGGETTTGQASIPKYWAFIYFGLCLPVLIYLLKYALTKYGATFGIQTPPYLQIYFWSQPFYVPKTDYAAFCLPPLAIALGQIQVLLVSSTKLKGREYLAISFYLATIAATLFLFFIQDIKNGMAYAALCVVLFALSLLFGGGQIKFWKKLLFVVVGASLLMTGLLPHIKKNDSWRTLVADTKVALQTDQYQQWKYAGAQGYPNNEYGTMVSITNYERAAWLKIGLELSAKNPLGYGLVEDSFRKMTKARWPEVSPNLSHSHSGWLDVILAVGFPGFACLFGALLTALSQAKSIAQPWKSVVIWALLANAVLWITTEVSATVTFAALIFWVCWAAGLTVFTGKRVVCTP